MLLARALYVCFVCLRTDFMQTALLFSPEWCPEAALTTMLRHQPHLITFIVYIFHIARNRFRKQRRWCFTTHLLTFDCFISFPVAGCFLQRRYCATSSSQSFYFVHIVRKSFWKQWRWCFATHLLTFDCFLSVYFFTLPGTASRSNDNDEPLPEATTTMLHCLTFDCFLSFKQWSNDDSDALPPPPHIWWFSFF